MAAEETRSEAAVPDATDLLFGSGISVAAAEAAVAIDANLQRWRRFAMKRELGHRALAALRADVDLAQLDVLTAIAAPAAEFGTVSETETNVGTVAERLGIDPSRASRVVAEMVAAGYARRAVSQADARRAILELTPAGRALVEAVRGYKLLLMGDFLSAWTEQELSVFVPLLERFSRWSLREQTDPAFTSKIEHLAQRLEAVRSSAMQLAPGEDIAPEVASRR